eukprot:429467_1
MIPTDHEGTHTISCDDVSILVQRVNLLEAEKQEYVQELVRAQTINDEFQQTIEHLGMENSLSRSQSELLSEQYKAHLLSFDHQNTTNFQLRLMLQEHITTINQLHRQNKILKELNQKYANELETSHETCIKLQRERQEERKQYEQKTEEIEYLIKEIQALQHRQSLDDSTEPVTTIGALFAPDLNPLLPEKSYIQPERDLGESISTALLVNKSETASIRSLPRDKLTFACSYGSIYSVDGCTDILYGVELQSLRDDNEALNARNDALAKELKEQDVKLSGVIRTFQNEKKRLLKLQNDAYIEMESKLAEKTKQIDKLRSQKKTHRGTVEIPTSSSFWSFYF